MRHAARKLGGVMVLTPVAWVVHGRCRSGRYGKPLAEQSSRHKEDLWMFHLVQWVGRGL